MWIPPIASAPRSCGRQLPTSATHAGQAGALHVKAETETVVTEDEVSSKDGLRTRDGAPGYGARSITDGIDWRDPSETGGRSIAGSAAGLGFGKPGAIQGGGPGRAKRSPSSAREGPGGHDQAADCDRGCQRGRPHSATGRGTRRKRGGSRDSKKCPTTWRSLWPSANRTASTPMNAARRAVLQAHVVPCCLIAKNNSTSTSITRSNPAAHCPGIAGAPHDSVLVVMLIGQEMSKIAKVAMESLFGSKGAKCADALPEQVYLKN